MRGPQSRPRRSPRRYAAERRRAGFDLHAFVDEHFEPPRPAGTAFRSIRRSSMEEHIRGLWPALTRPADAPDPHSSLIPLPNPYVVPGGRFREVYYWDSYFTMLGLDRERTHGSRAEHARQLRAISCAPSGTSRTAIAPITWAQPAAVLRARWSASTRRRPTRRRRSRYLDALEAEHAFWMDGASRLSAGDGVSPRRQAARRRGAQSLLGRPFRSRGPSRTARTTRSARRVPAAQRDAALPQPARGGGERLGLLQPLDARPEGSPHARDDGARAGGPQQPALSRRADDRRAAAAAAGGAGDAEAAARFAAAAEQRRRALLAAAYDSDERLLLRRALAHRRARDRPADAGRRGAALLRPRDAGAGSRRRGAPRARLPQAGRLRHDADRHRGSSGTRRTAGRRWSGSAIAGRAALRPRGPRRPARDALARAQPPHVSARQAR